MGGVGAHFPRDLVSSSNTKNPESSAHADDACHGGKITPIA